MNDAATPAKTKEDVRVYPVVDAEGKVRNVKARSIYDAVVHVYRPTVGKPLTGVEVAELYESGGRVETAVPAAKKEVQE